jgi:carotenoid cleavage dioxygenase-like enzyme
MRGFSPRDLHHQEDAGVLVTTALDVAEGFGVFLIINATTMQVTFCSRQLHILSPEPVCF